MPRSKGDSLARILSGKRKVKNTYLDSDQEVTRIETYASLTVTGTVSVYDYVYDLPSNSSAGDQAYVSSSKGLYISGSGGTWYRIKAFESIPYWDSEPASSYTVPVNGTAVTVDINALDSEEVNLTFSTTPDSDFNTNFTITRDSDNGTRFFIIANDSENSFSTTPVTGNVTFSATDGFNTINATSTFTATFTSIIDNSAKTVLLMKAAGNSGTNAVITYQDSSNASTGFTESGNPQASTFTPYRSGSYCFHFDNETDSVQNCFYNITYGCFSASELDWCVEGWIYMTADPWMRQSRNISGFFQDGGSYGSGTAYGPSFGPSSDRKLYIRWWNNAGNLAYHDSELKLHRWYHIAGSSDNGTIRIFVNGTSKTVSGTTTYNGKSGNVDAFSIGGNYYGRFNGYIKDFRVVNGDPFRTSNFTPPTVDTSDTTFVAPATYRVLTADRPNLVNRADSVRTLLTNGNATLQPFGPYDYEPWKVSDHAGSVYFDGTDDFITGNDDVELSNSDFTIEFWVYKTSTAAGGIIQKRSTGWAAGDWVILAEYNGTDFEFWNYDYSTSAAMLQGGYVARNAWTHVAVTRSSSTWTMWVNGTSVATATSSHTVGNNSISVILGKDNYSSGRYFLGGYIADARIVVGSAIYSSTFNVPTEPLSHVTNTKLLMQNKSEANVYDGAGANLYVLGGNTISSTTQRKFSTASSVYFDGTGDSIVVPFRSDLLPRTGDFTIEFWFYTPDATNRQDPYSIYTGTTGIGIILSYSSAGTVSTYHGNTVTQQSSGGQFSANTWYHLAVSRSGTTQKIFIDGTEIVSGTVSTDYDGATNLYIGMAANATLPFEGYIQDLRVTKGLARYTSNFTPPTEEFDL